MKHQKIEWQKEVPDSYYNENLSYAILIQKKTMGYLKVFNGVCTRYIGKKKALVAIEIDFDEYVSLPVLETLYQEVSKYPMVTLDYTILTSKDMKYEDLLKILKSFYNKFVKEYKLVGTYEEEKKMKYTMRYILGSEEKTLESKEIDKFKEKFMEHITKNGLEILF